MRNFFLSIFGIFYVLVCFGQEERIVISGTVTDGKKPIFNVHIVNESSQRGTISDKEGHFRIHAREGDILQFTDIQFKPRLIKIGAHHLEKDFIIILKSKTTELEEVLVETKNMAEKLELPNAGKEPLTPLQRKINYIQKGGIIDQIYAILSGEKKKLKKLQKLYEEERKEVDTQLDIQMVRNHFGDEFFIRTIGIPKKQIDAFIRYCLPDRLMFYFYRERQIDMIDIFIKRKEAFLQEINPSEKEPG